MIIALTHYKQVGILKTFSDSYDEARIHLKDSEEGSDWTDHEQLVANSRLRKRDVSVPKNGSSTLPKKRRTDKQPTPPVPPHSLSNSSFVFPTPTNTATLVGVTYHDTVSLISDYIYQIKDLLRFWKMIMII